MLHKTPTALKSIQIKDFFEITFMVLERDKQKLNDVNFNEDSDNNKKYVLTTRDLILEHHEELNKEVNK